MRPWNFSGIGRSDLESSTHEVTRSESSPRRVRMTVPSAPTKSPRSTCSSGRVALVAEGVELGEQLQLAAGVLEDHEGELAVHAAGHDAAGDAAHVARVLAGLEAGVDLVQRPDLVTRLILRGVDVSVGTPRRELGAPFGENVAAVLALLVHGGSRQAFSMARTLNFLEPWGTLTVTLSPGL